MRLPPFGATLSLLWALATLALSGCATCCGIDDYNYAAYGGRWQRHDMSHGRVGSAFTPSGYPIEDIFADEVLPVPQPQPSS